MEFFIIRAYFEKSINIKAPAQSKYLLQIVGDFTLFLNINVPSIIDSDNANGTSIPYPVGYNS